MSEELDQSYHYIFTELTGKNNLLSSSLIVTSLTWERNKKKKKTGGGIYLNPLKSCPVKTETRMFPGTKLFGKYN